jgi:hypothetical protein
LRAVVIGVGIALVAVAVAVWLFQPRTSDQTTKAKLPLGFEIEVQTAELGFAVVGIVLIGLGLFSPNDSGVTPPISAKPGDATEAHSAHPSAQPSTAQPSAVQPSAAVTEMQQAQPAPALSPQEVQTQLSVWESVKSNRIALAQALLAMRDTLAYWELNIASDTSRKALSNAIKSEAGRMIQPAEDLAKLRREYPWMPDLAAALSEDSRVGPLTQAAKAFADAATLSGEEDDEARVVRLRPLDGVRIPMKPARHSNRKPATDSDLKPAGIPI